MKLTFGYTILNAVDYTSSYNIFMPSLIWIVLLYHKYYYLLITMKKIEIVQFLLFYTAMADDIICSNMY